MKTIQRTGFAIFLMGVLVTGNAAHAAEIYSTGFEEPTFTLGGLGGQDGWSVFGSGQTNVQNGVVKDGTQAVSTVRSDQPGLDGAARFLSLDVSNQVLSVNIDAYIQTDPRASFWTVLDTQFGVGGDTGGIVDINITHAGEISIYNGIVATNTGIIIATDVWNSFAQVFDMSLRTASIYYNDSIIFSETFGGNSSVFSISAFYGQGFGDDRAYFDNYSSSVPEPSSIILMMSGFLLIARRFRTKLLQNN